jgi:hypothetical protein
MKFIIRPTIIPKIKDIIKIEINQKMGRIIWRKGPSEG